MKWMLSTLDELACLLDEYDSLFLECDGLTRVLNYVLHQQGIGHEVRVGRITHSTTGKTFTPHLWIEVPVGGAVAIVDYRARMWLGDRADVPHGVFWQESSPVLYEGEPVSGWQIINETLCCALIATSKTGFELPPGQAARYTDSRV